MNAMKNKVKEIIESSKSEEELLNNLDSLNRPLTNEELSFVSGGFGIVCNCNEDDSCTGLQNMCGSEPIDDVSCLANVHLGQ